MLKISHKASQMMGSNNISRMDDPNVGSKEPSKGTIEHDRAKVLIFHVSNYNDVHFSFLCF